MCPMHHTLLANSSTCTLWCEMLKHGHMHILQLHKVSMTAGHRCNVLAVLECVYTLTRIIIQEKAVIEVYTIAVHGTYHYRLAFSLHKCYSTSGRITFAAKALAAETNQDKAYTLLLSQSLVMLTRLTPACIAQLNILTGLAMVLQNSSRNLEATSPS